MPTTLLHPTDYEGNWSAHAPHGHADYIGYYVIRTIAVDGQVLAQPEIVEYFDGGHRYLEALTCAEQVRTTGRGWAVVGSHYSCGCVIR